MDDDDRGGRGPHEDAQIELQPSRARAGIEPWTMTVSDLRQAYQSSAQGSNGDSGAHKEDTMRTILKYRVDVRQPELKLPAGSVVRHVAHEPGNPVHIVTLWADCPDVPMLDAGPHPDGCRFHDTWELAVFGTEQSITLEPRVGFLGTAICIDRLGIQLVWHVFGRPRV